MTHDEHWEQNFQNIVAFMTNEKRRPSKYNPEEHQMLNWLKYQKKCLAQGKLTPQRAEKFLKLQKLSDLYLRKNQYVYCTPPSSAEVFCGDLFSEAD